jgi:hypothetical protein
MDKRQLSLGEVAMRPGMIGFTSGAGSGSVGGASTPFVVAGTGTLVAPWQSGGRRVCSGLRRALRQHARTIEQSSADPKVRLISIKPAADLTFMVGEASAWASRTHHIAASRRSACSVLTPTSCSVAGARCAWFSMPCMVKSSVLESHQLLKAVISKLAFRLDQNSPHRSHQLIGSVRQIFKVLGCVVFFRSGEGFVEALDRFSDPVAQILVQGAQESCLQPG